MLLYRQKHIINRPPKELIEDINTINDVITVIKRLIQLKCLPKYLPDIVGRLRLIFRINRNSINSTDIEKIYQSIWSDPKYFNLFPNDAIEAILHIEKIMLDPEIFKLVGNNPSSFFGLVAPSKEILNLFQSVDHYEAAIVDSYLRLLFDICDTYGYPYDQSTMSKVFHNIDLSGLVKFSSFKKHEDRNISHIEILKSFIDDYKEFFLQNNDNSIEIAKETESSFFKGMLSLYDIWNHPFTIGKSILLDIHKYTIQYKTEEFVFEYFNSLRNKNPEYSEMLEDIYLFYKNLFLIFMQIPEKKYSSMSGKYEYSYGNLNKMVYDTIIAYIYQNKEVIDNDFFFEIIPNIAELALDNITNLEDIQKENIREIVQCQINKIKHYDHIHEILPNSEEVAMNILLGIFDNQDAEEPVTEANVMKDDTGSKIKNANMPKDNRPRAKNGQYIKKTADAKSVGLTIGHAFNIFNQRKDQIENQIDNGFNALKDVLFGAKGVRTAVVEGKKFSITSLFKKLIGLMCLFSFGKVRAILFLIIRAIAQGKIKKAEQRRIIQDIEEELMLIDEKINDASSDGDRKAKYALMRSKAQLQNALQRIKYGMEAADDSKAIQKMRENNERMEF